MKTVVILAYEFHPFHRNSSTIGAQRPYQFAKYLTNFGWNTIVLCSDFKSRYTLDPKGHWKLRMRKLILEYLSTRNSKNRIVVPLPSLIHADMVDKLWLSTVEMDPRTGVFSSKKGITNLIQRKLCSLIKIFRGDHSQSWQKVAIYALEIIEEYGIKIDFQMACHGPDSSLFVAEYINRKKGIPWVADFRDPALIGKDKISSFFSMLMLKKKLSSCSGIINVTPYWTQLDAKMFNKQTFCIPNGFDEEEFRIPPQNLRPHTDRLLLFYFGGVKPGQSFKLLFEALQKIKFEHPNKFRNINFKYYGPGKDKVTKEKDRYCPTLKCSIESSISRENVLKEASDADLLILLTKKGQDLYFRYGFYPGKVFEYFGLNKPILAIPSDGGLIDDLLKETNTGISVNSAEEIVEYLTPLLEDGLREKSRPQQSQRKVFQYSRKLLTKRLSLILTKLHQSKSIEEKFSR